MLSIEYNMKNQHTAHKEDKTFQASDDILSRFQTTSFTKL